MASWLLRIVCTHNLWGRFWIMGGIFILGWGVRIVCYSILFFLLRVVSSPFPDIFNPSRSNSADNGFTSLPSLSSEQCVSLYRICQLFKMCIDRHPDRHNTLSGGKWSLDAIRGSDENMSVQGTSSVTVQIFYVHVQYLLARDADLSLKNVRTLVWYGGWLRRAGDRLCVEGADRGVIWFVGIFFLGKTQVLFGEADRLLAGMILLWYIVFWVVLVFSVWG